MGLGESLQVENQPYWRLRVCCEEKKPPIVDSGLWGSSSIGSCTESQPVLLQSFDSLLNSYSSIKKTERGFSAQKTAACRPVGQLLVIEPSERMTIDQLWTCKREISKLRWPTSTNPPSHFLVCPEKHHSGYYFLVESVKARLNLAGLESLVDQNLTFLAKSPIDKGTSQAFNKLQVKHLMILHLFKLSLQYKPMYRSEQIEAWIASLAQLASPFKALSEGLLDDPQQAHLQANI
jgi:hypothetical protein